MRTLKFVVINFILVFTLTICVGISKSEAFTFLGEFCWQFDETGQPPIMFRLAVSDVGNQHFILNGSSELFTGEIVNGNAEINGSDIIMTLNSSFSDVAATETAVYHVNLSGTLNGTFTAILADAPKPTGPITHEHISGTVTLVSCP